MDYFSLFLLSGLTDVGVESRRPLQHSTAKASITVHSWDRHQDGLGGWHDGPKVASVMTPPANGGDSGGRTGRALARRCSRRCAVVVLPVAAAAAAPSYAVHIRCGCSGTC